ncbi:MAG TPA: serine/threonine-protein kinase [Pyrinomonadaceae bacterium]
MTTGYRLLKSLGRGSFGEVWLAETEADGSYVAIKYLHDVTEGALNRFRREVRLLSEHINNRFVVDIKGYDLSASPPYFVMEYCEGGSLRQFVGKPWPWQAAARALSCAVQGLTGLHRVVGYHRDIKPDNLLRAKDGQGRWLVKVSDFGLGRTPNPGSSTMTNSPGGTFGYMAPELVSGGAYTPAADVYSLGVTIIELLTSRRGSVLLPSPQVPDAFTSLLNDMTSTDPQKRPPLMMISIRLHNVLKLVGQPTAQATTPQPAQAQAAAAVPQAKGGAGWVIAGGLALLALLAGGDDKEWDSQVGRYRGKDGRFKSG